MPSNSPVSIIIPVIRPEGAQRCIDSIRANAGIPEEQFEILTETDHDRIGCPKMVDRLTKKAKHDLVCFLGDDTEMEPWCLSEAIKCMDQFPDGWGLVGLADGTGRDLPTHWLAHKRLLEYLDGEFFSTEYQHCFCDGELRDRAAEIDRYVMCPEARIQHDHPLLKGVAVKDVADPDLKRVYAAEVYSADHKTYLGRKIARGDLHIGIGIPIVEDRLPVQFFVSFARMQKPDYTLLLPSFPVGSFAGNIADARNSLVHQALGLNCTHLIMMDTDQIYPPDTIDRLMSYHQPVVGTPVHRRWPPFDPILYRGMPGRYLHVPDAECYSGDLVPVDATGCGCVLYDLRVFIDMSAPWFALGRTDEGKPIGEDIMLCSKLRKAGVPIYVDTALVIDHMTTYLVNRSTYELYKKINHFQYRTSP